MFKKNIKIYSIVSAIMILEIIILGLIARVGFDATIEESLKTLVLLLPPIITAFIFQLISLKFQKENVIKTLKIILNTFAVIYYLYRQYIIFCMIMFIILLYLDSKNYNIN